MKRMMILLGLVGLFAAGCGPIQAADAGKDLFSNPQLSISPSNVFSCATCHSVLPRGTPDPQGRRYSGYTMYGAAQRPNFWGDGFTLLLDAVNFCYVQFMRAENFSPTDSQGLELLAYLESLAPAPDPAQSLTVVENINTAYLMSLPTGNPQNGQAVYTSACLPCHGDIHTGQGRLGSYVSIVPDDTINSFGAAEAPAVIAEKVRHGKFFLVGGNMALYSMEALADSELADILSYLLPSTPPTS
jgi:thiosulfate dehydrogenase